jgi:Uma2 family endonuclease
MSVALRAKPITAEEFERFDPEWRYDLIKGELHPMPPLPGEEHGAVTFDFALEVGQYVRDHDLGQCYAAETRFLVERNPDTAIGPDWAFIAKERLPKRRGKGFVPIAPDAVLEVRSPSDRPREVRDKVGIWLRAGVRLVWELDLRSRVMTVYRPNREPRRIGADGTLDGEDVLPGFHLLLGRLFEKDTAGT